VVEVGVADSTVSEKVVDALPPRLFDAEIVIEDTPAVLSGPLINKPLNVNPEGKPLAVRAKGSLFGSLNVLGGTRKVNVVPTVPVCEGIALATVGCGTGVDEGRIVILATAGTLWQLLMVQMAEIVIRPGVPVGTMMLPSRLTPMVPKYEIYPPGQPEGVMTTGAPPCVAVADVGESVGGLVGGKIRTETGVAGALVPLPPEQVAVRV
jgi:hypothetical protein